MATRKKKTTAITEYAVLPNGERHQITGTSGRYVICGGRQFRRSLVEIERAPGKEEAEEEKEEA